MKKSIVYTHAKLLLGQGAIDLRSDKLRCALMTEAYAPDPEHKTYADLTGETSGPGYTAGGELLAGQRWLPRGGVCRLEALDLIWPKSTIEVCAVVVYHEKTGTLLVYSWRGTHRSLEAEFVVEWTTEGILSF